MTIAILQSSAGAHRARGGVTLAHGLGFSTRLWTTGRGERASRQTRMRSLRPPVNR